MEKKLTVFLGGTCASSTWRQELIPMLDEEKYHGLILLLKIGLQNVKKLKNGIEKTMTFVYMF